MRLALVPLLLFLALPAHVKASTDDEVISADIGLNAITRAGHWNPVTLHLPKALVESPTRYVAVEATDPDGQWLRSPLVRPVLINNTTWSARLLVKLGNRNTTIKAVVIDQENSDSRASPQEQVIESTVLQIPKPVESSQEILFLLGDLVNAKRVTRLAAREDGSRMLVISPKPEAVSIPVSPAFGPAGLMFDGVDQVIICGNAIKQGIPDEQLLELDAWIRQGGDMLFIAGTSLPSALLASPAIKPWLPGTFDRLIPLRRTAALETYARASRPLARRAIETLQIPIFDNSSDIQGVIEASVGIAKTDPPLVVRRAYGFGQITWIGVDLDTQTFRSWSGTDSLLLNLLDIQNSGNPDGRAGEVRRGGLDLAGQLRLAIDHFIGVSVIPFELIALISLLYVGAIYPLDWWIARRSEQFRWVTWLALPLIVLGFTGITWSTSKRFKADGWQIHTAGLFDIDQVTKTCRASSFAGIWASDNGHFDLSVSPAKGTFKDDVRSVASWFAAAGRNIGGPDALSPHTSLAGTPYEYGPAASELQNIPIAAASSQLFEAKWFGRLPTHPIQSTLSRTGQGTLRGTLTSQLQTPLQDCVLMHAGWLYDVGTLHPGKTFDLDTGRGPKSLGAVLTKKRAVKDRNVSARWKSEDRDIIRILEVAGMHRATGGAEYTGLQSGRLEHIDMTRLLGLNRIILVGKGPPATKWTPQKKVESKDKSFKDAGNTTLWRIVLEVRN